MRIVLLWLSCDEYVLLRGDARARDPGHAGAVGGVHPQTTARSSSGKPPSSEGAADPARLVREFKRRVGDSVPLVVGGSPFSAQALTARLLAWVVGMATERQGGPPEHVCVTYPANWGPFKRDLLGQAIELAGLRGTATSTRTEPEAAAIAYASRDRVAEGDRIAVYDLGGGTFDAAVLVREADGFRFAGPPEGDRAARRDRLRRGGVPARAVGAGRRGRRLDDMRPGDERRRWPGSGATAWRPRRCCRSSTETVVAGGAARASHGRSG